MKLKKFLIPIFLTLSLLITIFVLAGVDLIKTSSPTTSFYTLENIFNLINSNSTSTEANHLLSPTDPVDSSMHSISEIYVALANLIEPANLASSTVTYLGVSGGDTVTPVSDITKEFDPSSSEWTVTGFTLDDVYNLIIDNNRITAPTHTYATTSAPASSGHTLKEIYNALKPGSFIIASDIATGTTYLGVTGTYVVPPTYSVVFDGQSGTPDFSTTTDIISGNTISLPSDPTRSNYTFGGWFTEIDGGGTEFTASTPVVANITVYAKWTAIVAICEVSGDVTDPDCWSVANNGGRAWGPTGYTTGLTELTSAVDNGPANTVTLAALGSNYQAATYCDTLDEGGHQDWYLPAKSQLIAGLNAYKDNYNSDPSWGGFAGEWVIYWSSTESSGSNNNAWYAYYGSNQVTSGATNKDWTGHYDHCLR